MQKTNRHRTEMQWKQEDVTQMKSEADSFSVVLDKGTLDALMTDESEEVTNRVRAYLSEMSRVLKIGGRFICVSLLQPHILKLLLEYLPVNNFMFRVVRCVEAEQKTAESSSDGTSMPVFVVVGSKFKALPQKLLEVCMAGEKIQRLSSEEEIMTVINDIQKSSMVTNGLVKDSSAALSDEIMLELHTPENEIPRYTIYVLDQKPKKGNGKFAAFIVPQGREIDWLFSTSAGRRKLQDSSGHDRLAIVSMHREYTYPEWNKVQDELNPYIKNLAPSGMSNASVRIPYLSLDSNVGHRELICKGSSDFSGPYVIEDVLCDNNQMFRRLIFMRNQFTIQSEALLKLVYSKDGTVMEKFIDKSYLACQHHLYMTAGLNITGCSNSKAKNKKGNIRTEALLIGLGGGGLVSFIQETLKHVKITAVELDPSILSIATEFFELNQTKNLEVVIQDGLDYLKDVSKKENIKKLNAILFDVDGKDSSIGMSCPPQDFLSTEILDAVKKLLKDDGLFILNLVCRDDKLKERVIADLKVQFTSICSFKLKEDLNEIIYCSPSETSLSLDETKWKKMFEKSVKEINQIASKNKIVANDEELIEVTEFINSLKM